jgi:hypothetical protein
MQSLLSLILFPFFVIAKVFTSVFGTINWSMPHWLTYMSALGKRSPAKLVGLLVIITGVAVLSYKVYDYYHNLPTPILVDAQITPPQPFIPQDQLNKGENNELPADDTISPLTVRFIYTVGDYKLNSSHKRLFTLPNNTIANPIDSQTSMLADFPSVAPLALIGEKVTKGIIISPAIEGDWTWQDDRTLTFLPRTHWPAGQEYEITFSEQVFETQERFTDHSFTFFTPELEGQINLSEFTLNAQLSENQVTSEIPERRGLSEDGTSSKGSLKQAMVEISFNYPVDIQSVRKSLSIAYQIDGNKLGKPLDYRLSISENMHKLSASVDIDSLPDQARILELKFDTGIKSIYGGEPTSQVYQSKILVPDVYSFLKVESASADIVRSPENEPEQFVLLSFTDPISRSEFLNKFSIYMLPKQTPGIQTNQVQDVRRLVNKPNYNWQSPREVTSEVIAQSQKLDFSLMPNENANSMHYQLKLDVEPNRQLYLKIDSGLSSANGFVQRAFFDKILSAPQYPQEVQISGEGSILSYSKDQRLAFSTRGINDVRVSIGKVMDEELYHLVSQTQGDISNPDFYSWHFNETNLAEFTTQFIKMNSNRSKSEQQSGSLQFASVNLNKLVANTKQGLGLFFIEIKGWNTQANQEIYGVSDKLLLLITDLGVIVKTSQNNSQDIFVQSIKSGKPVAGAQVELLAKNGTTLFNKSTNNTGHVNFPAANGYAQEKMPVVYVIKQKGDVSFIPYNRYTRQINYSRFDVGGEYNYGSTNPQNNERVNAYMFSDRGIYRPGETVNIGMIVKGKNLQSVDNIPLELVIRNAQYTEVYSKKLRLSMFGFIEEAFATLPNFITGNYTASLHLMRDRQNERQSDQYRERQIGNLSFQIEAFAPDTMTITSKVVDQPTAGWLNQSTFINQVTLSNLFGVPAQNRRITSELVLSPIAFSFDQYPDVQFYTPKATTQATQTLERIVETLKPQTTNASGSANIEVDLRKFTKGSYSLSLQTKGFEASGGRSVSVTTGLLFSPSAHLVGYKPSGKLDFINLDSARSLALIAVDNTLKPIALDDLTLRLSKEQSVSTLVKQYNGRYQYQSIEKREVISQSSYALPDGFKNHQLDTSKAGKFILEIIDTTGLVLLSTPYTVVGASNDSGKLDKNAELNITLNKSDYQEGETIELSIQAPYAGSGLISIESDKLHSFVWFSSPTNNSVQEISIPKGIEGNAYVNVAFVRDLGSKEIFTSPLSYAVVPFSIDRSKRTLDVDIVVEEIVQPGKPMSIGINVSQNAKVAVFAVDVGILQVANYRLPDPLAHFFKKRALNVRTMQILDLILPDFALSQMLSAAGGDIQSDAMMEKIAVTGSRMTRSQNPFERNIQDPAVFWSGVVDAKKGSNQYSFDVPNDFTGALRVMAVAVGEQAIGRAQQNTLVRGPFVISPNVLNQAAPGDEFEITVSVANVVEQSASNASVNVRLSTSEHLTIVGSNSSQMLLSENQEDAVRFRLKANSILGAANINFDVSMTDASGKTWQSSRTSSLSIRPAMPFEINIDSGFAKNGDVTLQTPKAFFKAQSNKQIKASVSPLVITEGLSDYLGEYPHGCTEQIVSQVFPLVGLSNLAKYGPSNETVSAHFVELINALRQRQGYAGGFTYWANEQKSDIDTSVYVLHFLIEAKELGFAVPQDMLQSGIRYLNDTASAYVQNPTNGSLNNSLQALRQRAKVIYLLTRSGVVSSNLLIDLVSVLNKEHKTSWRNDLLSAYIAASYSLMQQTEEAQALISDYDLSRLGASNNSSGKTWLVEQAFAGLSPPAALDAQYLYLVAKHFPDKLESIAGQAVLNISQAIYRGEYNTISAAYSMLALGAYHGAVEGALAINNSAKTNNLQQIDEQIMFIASTSEASLTLEPSYSPFASALYPVATKSIQATIPTKTLPDAGGLYYVNLQSGYQVQVPSKAVSKGIELQKAFINSSGEIATNIKQGDELTVRLRVRALEAKNVANIAIVDLLPGGFEVIRESVDRSSGRWQSDYIDIQEDRIVFYGPISNRVTDISFQVKVTAAGTFVVPPSFAEAMYDRSLRAYSPGSTIDVLPRKP